MERRWMVVLPVAVPAAVGLAGILAWLLLRGWLLWGWWGVVTQRPLTGAQQEDLQTCRPMGWWGLVKVLSHDARTPCGDAWIMEQLAEQGSGRDRRLWLEDWVVAPASTPRQRLRAAMAVSLQGAHPPREPTWLLLQPEAPTDLRESVVEAVARDTSWAAALGPRWRALGAVEGLASGHTDPQDVAPILDALLVVPDSVAHQRASVGAAAVVGIDDVTLEELRRRRETGLPMHGVSPTAARTIARNARCEPWCLPMWLDLLADHAEREGWEPLGIARGEIGMLGPWIGGLGGRPIDAERVAWWADWTASWVAASPDPTRRLASLLGRQEGERRPDPMSVIWEATGTPWTAAAMVLEVGRRAEVDVEVGVGDDVLWVTIEGARYGVDRCGKAVPGLGTVDPEPWPAEAVVAQALIEAALASAEDAPREALRRARAAERLDPVGASAAVPRVAELAGEPVPDFAVAFAVGAALTRPPASPAGAEGARSARSAAVQLSACED